MPDISPEAVDRPRVVSEILEKSGRFPFVQVVAPAGSGKTTALVQAARAAEAPVAWLTLESWDTRPGRLLEDLIAALAEVVPGLRASLDPVLRGGADPAEATALIRTAIGPRAVLLVVDDIHVAGGSSQACATLSALTRGRGDGLRLVYAGRPGVSSAGLPLEARNPAATIGESFLRADLEEAASILHARDSATEAAAALRVSGGWVAGLVFEAWRAGGADADDRSLQAFLESEVRVRLSPDDDRFLVRCSVFDRVDRARASALAGDDGVVALGRLRDAGVPAVWDARDASLRLHPRVREVLREELDAGSPEELRETLGRAATAYEREGELEEALDAYLEVGNLSAAGRLLPEVLGAVVARFDLDRAWALLDAVPLDPEPAPIVLARLSLTSLSQRASEAAPVLDGLAAAGTLDAVVAEEPAVGALACNHYAALGRIEEAVRLVDAMPAGRAAEAARLLLSAVRDDPSAPVPPFQGDVVDAVIARGLYCRGRIVQLRRIANPVLARLSGIPELAQTAAEGPAPVARLVSGFQHAVSTRDVAAARECVARLGARGSTVYLLLADVELAVRLERDPTRALETIGEALDRPLARTAFYREQFEMWRGASLLLAGRDAEALRVLRDVVGSMQRGDRRLALPEALVYLAEAEWRAGDEDAADRATRDAQTIARESAGLGRLILALADFPGVLSRALDLESEPDGEWHALGRAVLAAPSASRSVGTASVHLRELGEPALLVDGVVVRPKIRKSIEVLSFLLSRPRSTATREEILTALWNGRDDYATRAYLRQAIRHLRNVLPAGLEVTTEGEALSVAGLFTSEIAELEALLRTASVTGGVARRAHLLEAIEMSRRGAFLEGSADVSWIDERRARIEAWIVDARLDAAATLLEESRLLEAFALAGEVLERDPLVERAWRTRMRVLGLLGDQDGVLQAFRACATALAEVGLEPSRATTELARSLRA